MTTTSTPSRSSAPSPSTSSPRPQRLHLRPCRAAVPPCHVRARPRPGTPRRAVTLRSRQPQLLTTTAPERLVLGALAPSTSSRWSPDHVCRVLTAWSPRRAGARAPPLGAPATHDAVRDLLAPAMADLKPAMPTPSPPSRPRLWARRGHHPVRELRRREQLRPVPQRALLQATTRRLRLCPHRGCDIDLTPATHVAPSP